jgi:predicted nuclease of restriction endonuclease-like RecB superfamily
VLTADLVRARRRGDELFLVGLDKVGRARALAIAEAVLGEARAHVGKTREELEEAIGTIDVEPRDERLKAGLVKLTDDRCEFEVDETVDAAELRSALFLRATAERRRLGLDARFDRDAVVAAFALERGLEPGAVERGLYADLRGAHVLREVAPMGPSLLVEAWERGQAQAVLLRAVRVTVDVACASAGAARALFRRLKFLRLLHTITRSGEGPAAGESQGSYRVVIDGPFSLFESSTKYGLQLAMVLPALEACERWSLVADVRWGAEREALVFKLEGGCASGKAKAPPLPDEVAALVASFKRLDTDWRVAPASSILELPGVGLCVPDLVFKRGDAVVHLEVMGYWSREAVWRRVELVQQGLAAPILFAVSSRLRVSEEVLADDAPSGLYVYKGAMSASAVRERLEGLASRQGSPAG